MHRGLAAVQDSGSALRPIAVAAIAMAVVASLWLARPPLALAAGNTLDTPVVNPRSGTVQTSFSFSVHYLAGNQGIAPSSVVANVGATVVPLSLSSGIATDGTYSGASLLPVGTHNVTFAATAAQQGNPTLISNPPITVTVTPLPTPTPAPTAPPTPTPTPGPTPPPTPIATGSPTPIPTPVGSASVGGSASPGASPSPGESTSAAPSESGLPGGSQTATPSPTPAPGPGNADGGVNFGTLLLVIAGAGLVTVGLLAMLLGAVRRGGSRPPPGPTPAPTTPPTPARPPAFWEASNRLEDEPIGTVEDESHEPPPEPAAEREVAEADEPIDEPPVPDDDPPAWQGVPPWDEEP